MPRRSKLTLSHWARPVIKSGALPAATRKLATFVRGRKAQEMDQWLEDFKQTIEAATPRLLLVSEGQSEQPRTEDHWVIETDHRPSDRLGGEQSRAVRAGATERRFAVCWLRAGQLGAGAAIPESSLAAAGRVVARLQPSLAARDVVRAAGKANEPMHSTQPAEDCL